MKIKKWGVLAFVVALFVSLVAIVAGAAVASAHTAGVSGDATCQDNSTYKVSWSVKLANVPQGQLARIKLQSSLGGGSFAPYDPSTKIIADGVSGNATVNFTQSEIPGNATSAGVTISAHWTPDGHLETPSGSIELKGNCGEPPAQEKWTCDGYFTGGYVYIDGAWIAGDFIKQRDLTAEEWDKLGCQPKPVAPEFFNRECHTDGVTSIPQYRIKETDGVKWQVSINGGTPEDVQPGTLFVDQSSSKSVTVKVTAIDVKTNEQLNTWTHEFPWQVCSTLTPTPTPTHSTPVTPKSTPSKAHVVPVKKVQPVSPASKEGALASTGSNVVPWAILISLLALLFGTGMILFGRSKTLHSGKHHG